MKRKRLLSVIIILAGLLPVTLLGRAIAELARKQKPIAHGTPVASASMDDTITYDTTLVRRFAALIGTVDFAKGNCFMSGSINLKDGKDSLNNLSGLRFLFDKRDSAIYYRIGASEIFNNGQINVLVDNANRKVLVSADRFQQNSPLTGFKEITAKLQSEHYRLIQQHFKGSLNKLVVLNEYQIGCKEMSMAYDTVSNTLKEIYTRTADVSDPMNKTKERRLRVSFEKIGESQRGDIPMMSEVLKRREGGFVLKGKYSAYELIIL
jgi:hypothetical protein